MTVCLPPCLQWWNRGGAGGGSVFVCSNLWWQTVLMQLWPNRRSPSSALCSINRFWEGPFHTFNYSSPWAQTPSPPKHTLKHTHTHSAISNSTLAVESNGNRVLWLLKEKERLKTKLGLADDKVANFSLCSFIHPFFLSRFFHTQSCGKMTLDWNLRKT